MAKITNPTHEREAEAREFIFSMQTALRQVDASPEGQERDRVMRLGLDIFKKAAEERNAHTIIAADRAFNQAEFEQFADSPDMRNSLRQGIRDLEIIETYLNYVKDPARYKRINETYMREKNRRGDLPYDEARQCLRSHAARLKNLDTSRMDKPERDILEQRRKNMKIAEDVYIAKQKTALNIKE